METDSSNRDFSPNRSSLSPSALQNSHAISFQSGVINKMHAMVPVANYFGVNSRASLNFTSEMVRNTPPPPPHGLGFSNTTSTSGSPFLDSALGLNNKDGVASEWSSEEQYRLEEGLGKYSSEPSITKYIKIAAGLRNKTVRDVALRCRWMMGKRRKSQEYHHPKKWVPDRKDNVVMANKSSENSKSAALSSVLLYQSFHKNGNSFLQACGVMRHMLEQNTEAFNRIVANFSTHKLKDNIRLFGEARENIGVVLENIKEMPGVMSDMPPLPVSINEDLVRKLMRIHTPPPPVTTGKEELRGLRF